MDAKLTLSLSESAISAAKLYAARNKMSLSRLTEHLYNMLANNSYTSLEDLPISNWVSMVAEGEPEYITTLKSRKQLKQEFYNRKK